MLKSLGFGKSFVGVAAVVATLLLTSACAEQGNDRLRDKAAVEAGEGAEKTVNAENKNIEKWSSELEADLAKRQKMFKALRGTYLGVLSSGSDDYEMKITFVPTIPPYKSGRIRTVEEVRFDLLNLDFNVQVLSWKKSNPLTSVGCRFEEVRPDLENGQIVLASEECPNFYSINVYKPISGVTDVPQMIQKARNGLSQQIAAEVLAGTQPAVSDLVGEMQPTSNSNMYVFKLERL